MDVAVFQRDYLVLWWKGINSLHLVDITHIFWAHHALQTVNKHNLLFFMNSVPVHNLKVSTEIKWKTFCHHSYSFTNLSSLHGKTSCSILGVDMYSIIIVIFYLLILGINVRISVTGHCWDELCGRRQWTVLCPSQMVSKGCESYPNITLNAKTSTRPRTLWCLYSNLFKSKQQLWGTGGKSGATTLEGDSPWWRDTSKVTVAMSDTHQSRDIPKELQPV